MTLADFKDEKTGIIDSAHANTASRVGNPYHPVLAMLNYSPNYKQGIHFMSFYPHDLHEGDIMTNNFLCTQTEVLIEVVRVLYRKDASGVWEDYWYKDLVCGCEVRLLPISGK